MKMTREVLVGDAIPAYYFNFPPFKSELFYEPTGAYGVMNRNNFNCLTFKSCGGSTLTDFKTAQLIAEKWNNEYK